MTLARPEQGALARTARPDRPRPEPGPRAQRQGVLHRASIGTVRLESGQSLPEAEIAYETWGSLDADGGNAVLVLHALTGDSHAAHAEPGPGATPEERAWAEAPGWWEGLIGPGAAIDTERYFVVCPNVLGGCSGSTGPASPAPASVDPSRAPWGPRFPRLSLRDVVAAEAVLADQLGVGSWHLVIGGSMGGARALEWALTEPDRVRACAVVASGASCTADQLAWGMTQSLAIRQDPHFAEGQYYGGPEPEQGLGLARRIAHITYRSATELHYRFGRQPQSREDPPGGASSPPGAGHNGGAVPGRGQYRVESYLDHHAQKLVRRFDANSYLVINELLMGHDVARGRGGLQQALARARCRWVVVAVDSDRLFPPRESELLAEALPGRVGVHEISSPSGHDGFLLETSQLARILRDAVLG